MLYKVPCACHPLIICLVVVVHSQHHVCGEDLLDISFKHVGSNTSTKLSNQDEDKEESIGVDHAGTLREGTTAAKEGNDKDDNTDDNKEYGGVDIIVPKKVKKILSLNLNISTETDKSESSESEDQVEDDKEILDYSFTTVLHVETVRCVSQVYVDCLTECYSGSFDVQV